MNLIISRSISKQILLKSYPRFYQMEDTVNILKKDILENVQWSLLWKLNDKDFSEQELKAKEKYLKSYFNDTLLQEVEVGFFDNYEIGYIAVAGPLSYLFLHDVNGKKLGSLCGGPYGILRGLGGAMYDVTKHIKSLNAGDYLMIIRGFKKEIKILEQNLFKLNRAV